MRKGPATSPRWWRYSCSKKGISAAAFSTGRSARLATVWNTSSCAAARAFAETAGRAGTIFLVTFLVTVFTGELFLLVEALPLLETYFFLPGDFLDAVFEGVFLDAEGLGCTATATAAAATRAIPIWIQRLTSYLIVAAYIR